MLHWYEKRTGKTVSLGDLKSGSLKSKVTEDDYNINIKLLILLFLTCFTLNYLIGDAFHGSNVFCVFSCRFECQELTFPYFREIVRTGSCDSLISLSMMQFAPLMW